MIEFPERSPYLSFWMGGYEGADHVNGNGIPLDMVQSNGHGELHEADYEAAAALGIRTVRESIGWRLVEPVTGQRDWSRVVAMAEAARRQKVQLLWTLMHYGTPDDVSLHDDALIERFADFAAEAARVLKPLTGRPPVYTPINEIGFLAWAATETQMIMPCARGVRVGQPMNRDDALNGIDQRSGYAMKRRLVRAALAAMRAISGIDLRARFLHVEPVVHVVRPRAEPELEPLARRISGHQWQVWDLLSGLAEPALGGSPRMLDLVGVNYYHSGQWEAGTERRLSWADNDPRRRAFAHLLAEVAQRYGRPLTIAETSHVGEGRGAWLTEVTDQVIRARAEGVPIQGLCLYPLVDRPDWNDGTLWHRSGMFDVLPPARGSPLSGPTHNPADRDTGEPSPGQAPDRTGGPPAPPSWSRELHPAYAAALVRCQSRLNPTTSMKVVPMPTLIVFCHLRWGFVYQRPQHLMSRLARHYRVLFVEEPVEPRVGEPPHLQSSRPAPGVEVLTPHTGIAAPGFHDDHLPVLAALLADHLSSLEQDDVVAWFYTPMALPLLPETKARCVVYDCMDELSAFKGAPRQLRQRETALMTVADIVLTGGPSLYEVRRGLHPNVHCLPSAVDAAHFAPARLLPNSVEGQLATQLHADMAGSRLGFYGVIDERFDVALVGHLADARPQWHWVMAGPVVKIDHATLPQRPNLHWLGMHGYAVLPYLLAAWDVALLPFALNESTRFISPTKTLEYMAGRKPIVSTPVHDVAALYGEVVHIAGDAAGFLAGCESALSETPEVRSAREQATEQIVRRMSWDDAAQTALSAMAAVLRRAPTDAAPISGQEIRFGT